MSANVGYATLQVIPSAKNFTKTLENEVGPQMTPLGKKAGAEVGRSMGTGLLPLAGKVFAPVAAGLAAVGIGSFLVDATNKASDLNETVSKTSAIFGAKAMPALTKFADAAAKNMGLSKGAALDALSTFGIMAKGAGLSGGAAVKFSTQLAGLSGDLASFYNASTEDVNLALGAALRGEMEPARRFGIMLDDVSLRQQALKMGLIKTTKQALTPQQKALAAQALILKQTKVAQGDFQRTSGGLANQQRILKAEFDNVTTGLGQAFLPIALKVVGFLNSTVVPIFSKVADAVGVFFEALSGGEVSSQGFLGAVGNVAYFIRDTVVPAVVGLYQTFMTNVWPAIQKGAAIIAENLQPAITALGEYWRNTLYPAVQKMAPVFVTIAKVIGIVVGAVLILVSWLLGKVVPIVLTVVGVFVTFAVTLMSKVAGAIEWVIAHFGQIVTYFQNLPGKIVSGVGNLAKTLWSAGTSLISGFINGITSKASDLVNAIRRTITDHLPDFVKNALGIRSPSRVFAELGKWTMRGFTDGIDGEAASAQRAMASAIAPPSLDGTTAGGGSPLSATLGGNVARLYLDGRQVAEAVFTHGGREYAYGRA